MNREERIRQYAYEWYEIYKGHGFDNNPKRDWARAEHLVDAEDNVKEKYETLSD